MKPQPIKFPLDFHPGVFKHDGAASGAKVLLDAVSAINDALARVNDPRALTKAIRDKAATAIKSAQSAHGQTAAASESKAKLIREQLKKRTEFEKETREHIRTSKNPAATVRQFITGGDLEAAAAAFRAPPYLSGLDDEMMGVLYTMAKSRFTPELAEQEAHADDGVQRLGRAIERFNAEVAKLDKHLSTSDEAIAASLLKREDAA